MRIPTLLALLCAVSLSAATARTWTSANGDKTFEGEFVSLAKGLLTVRKTNGRETTFKVTLLSEEDQKFAAEQAAKLARKAKEKKAAEAAANAAVPKELSGNLVKLKGKRLSKIAAEDQKMPQYYFVYFAASW